MFADGIYFDCVTVVVFFPEVILMLIHFIHAQLCKRYIESARRRFQSYAIRLAGYLRSARLFISVTCSVTCSGRAVSHAWAMLECQASVPDDLNRPFSQHSLPVTCRRFIWYVRVCVVLWHHSVPEPGGDRHWLHCHSRPEYDVSAPSAYARSKSVENCMCYNDNADVSSLSAIRRERCWHGS